MFGAAPGRETIFIFCIRWINCSRLYIISSSFSRDGESIFKKINKTQRRRKEPGSSKRSGRSSSGVWGVFIAKPTDWQTTLHSTHPTDSPAFNLLFTFLFGFFDKRKGWEVDPRAEMWNSLCPFDKSVVQTVILQTSSNLFVYFFFVYLLLLLSSDSMEYWHLQSGAEKVNNDITMNKGL